MQRNIDSELRHLREEILAMGGCVESALTETEVGLFMRNAAALERVHEFEMRINQYHVKNDEIVVQLMARQSPLAADLRWIIAYLKMNAELERMGDQLVNIAHNAKRMLAEPDLGSEVMQPLRDMSEEVRKMIRACLDAVVNRDAVLAQAVLEQDDVVDNYKNTIFRSLIGWMSGAPDRIERAMNLILIARNMERLGDHATNIAEDVIYATTGVDVRHGHHLLPPANAESR